MQHLIEQRHLPFHNNDNGSWRNYIKLLPEEDLDLTHKKLLEELRSAGATVQFVEVYSEKYLQVVKAPTSRVFSEDFTKISNAVLKNKSDFFQLALKIARVLRAVDTLLRAVFTLKTSIPIRPFLNL